MGPNSGPHCQLVSMAWQCDAEELGQRARPDSGDCGEAAGSARLSQIFDEGRGHVFPEIAAQVGRVEEKQPAVHPDTEKDEPSHEFASDARRRMVLDFLTMASMRCSSRSRMELPSPVSR
jgi:hypothetical protein